MENGKVLFIFPKICRIMFFNPSAAEKFTRGQRNEILSTEKKDGDVAAPTIFSTHPKADQEPKSILVGKDLSNLSNILSSFF